MPIYKFIDFLFGKIKKKEMYQMSTNEKERKYRHIISILISEWMQ